MLPAKIKGLNQDTSDESNDEEEENPVTKEALEQKTQQGYRDALILQKQNKLLEAEQLLRELLESDVILQANGKVKYINGKLQPSIFHLKYCCYLNLGNILFKMKNFEDALQFYLKATELDDTDLNLWYRIGNVAMKISNLTFAVSAFEETLLRNPNHWPSLDSIIIATYAIGDYMATLLYISQSLTLDSNYTKGIILKERIFKEHPTLIQDFKLFYPNQRLETSNVVDVIEAEKIFQSIEKLKSKDPALKKSLFGVEFKGVPTQGLLKPLKHRTWLHLGKSLLKLYNHLYYSDSDMAFFSNINLTTVDLNKNLVKEPINKVTATIVEEIMSVEINNSVSIIADMNINANCRSEDEVDDVVSELLSVAPKANESEKDGNDGGNKSKKRKCSPTLADQFKICDKRRSTRNKTVLKNNEQSLTRTLKNLIPAYLLPEKDKVSKSGSYDFLRWNEDSFDTMDIYRLLFEPQEEQILQSHPINKLTEQTRAKLVQEEDYFGTEKEKTDIEWYLRINNDQTMLELIEAYTRELASKWEYTWPMNLADIFVEMFEILIKHGFEGNRIKLVENWNVNNEFDEECLKLLREKSNVCVLYGELLLNQNWDESDKEQPLGSCILGGKFSSLLFGDIHDACSVLNAVEKDTKLWMRSCWLEALMFLQKKDIFAACSALSMLIEEIPNPNLEVRLPNVKQFHLISLSGAKRLLNTLNRNQNLNEVKELFVEHHFDKVLEILQDTLKPNCQQLMYLPNENTLSRYEQYNILFSSFWESKKYEELFKWCEIGFYEAFSMYRKSFFEEIESNMKAKWATLVMSTLNGLMSCMKIVGPSVVDVLKPEYIPRLVQTLSNLVCHQIETTEPIAEITADVVTPWILLANVVDYSEKKQGINRLNDENAEVSILPSVNLLFVAHEYLGKRCWCCFDDGALLFYTLNVIEPLYHNSIFFSETWNTLCEQIDQIFYCLYSHPFKRNRPRHVQDHNSLGLALTWNRAIQAYLLYRPQTLPMYDAGSKNCTITADTETLLKRVISLIPDEFHPARYMDSMNQYMNSSSEDIPQNENKLPSEVTDVFYLLGDFHFKNKIMAKAIKYYLSDVCLNPNRVDSWAAMALARGSQLETKLNSCETISNESEILKKAELTNKCYKTALKLDRNQSTLWIEYGVFCYATHGFCSRLLKQETTNLSLQMFELVENKKNNFLKTSFESFNCANEAWLDLTSRDEEVQDERWLHHYMLGKIAEKKEENVNVFLNHYYEASRFLHQCGAQYPMRILYSSPQYYSVEALEIYYRIHASILKLLEVHEEKPLDSSTIDVLRKFTNKMAESPFTKARENSTKNVELSKSLVDKNKEAIPKDTGSGGKRVSRTDCINQEVKTIVDEIIFQVVKHGSSVAGSKRKLDDVSQEDAHFFKKSRADVEFPIAKERESSQPSMDDVPFVMEVEEECITTPIEEQLESKCMSKTSSLQSSVTSLAQSSSLDNSSSSSCESDDTVDEEAETYARQNPVTDETLETWQKVRKGLVDKCIHALEECIRRFPEHFKSFYRLSHHYFRSKLDKDIEKARKLLVEEKGLFADRTNKNFFNGIWRNPTAEIDRFGSFAFHMSRSIHLLIDILTDTQDYKTLLQLSNQLRFKPELDKKYLRDNERELICKEALSLSAQTLRKIIDNVSFTEKEENKMKLLLDVCKCYHRVSKNFSQKDAPFGKLLIAMYSKFTGRKDKVSIDQIQSFCKTVSTTGFVPRPLFDTTDLNKTLTHVFSLQLSDSKSALLNYPTVMSTKLHLPAVQKMPSEAKSNFPPIPNNLKNLPSSISVTTVQKPKVSGQHTMDRNVSSQFSSKSAISVRNHLKKEKAKFKSDHMKVKIGMKSERSAMKPTIKEKKYKSKPIDHKADTKMDKCVSIIPVLRDSKTVPVVQLPRLPPKAQQSISKPKVSIDMLTVSKERPSLVITPIENKNQPTLQQKLAARQLANTARSSSSSCPSKTSKSVASKAGSSSYDVSCNLGSSGVSIFPVPVDTNSQRYNNIHSPIPQFHNQHAMFVSTSYPTHVAIPTSSKLKVHKKSDAMDVNRLKAFSREVLVEQPSKRKSQDQKLKKTLKALEESPGIIITPKLPKTSELEVLPVE